MIPGLLTAGGLLTVAAVGAVVGYATGYISGRVTASDLQRHQCIRCRRDQR